MPSVPKPERKKRDFKRPAPKEAVPLEDVEQHTVIEWLIAHKIRHTAIVPDRRICNRLGYVPGIPDILIFDRPTVIENGFVYVGTAVEMKRRKGGQVSSEQEEWLAALKELGWATSVCYGCDQAIEFLSSLGYGK